MRKTLFIINMAAFVASIAWLIYKPDYEPLISSLLTLGGLISFIFTKPKNKKVKLIMSQKAGRNSKQYQSGGNMTIKN
jgi:uncharacterized membrane-anchored protein YitT (DUF2179 family)